MDGKCERERRDSVCFTTANIEGRRVPRDKGGMLDATVLGQHRQTAGAMRDSLAIRLIILPKRDLRTYLPDGDGVSPGGVKQLEYLHPPLIDRSLIDHHRSDSPSREDQFTTLRVQSLLRQWCRVFLSTNRN